MADKNHTDYYNELLLDFIGEPDPLFSMLQWLTDRMMDLESDSKAGGAFFGEKDALCRYSGEAL